ncbi:hypothetical protein PR048_015028 [Dryococelus australis]|uniref:Uncharacterized protein n=1 Tax=Dryococelus australis TaxID=614101 RepID=A0ABQ9HFT9_9NEOP|nr:hypothetical protein PR048_015028 [Dryococelus australis]
MTEYTIDMYKHLYKFCTSATNLGNKCLLWHYRGAGLGVQGGVSLRLLALPLQPVYLMVFAAGRWLVGVAAVVVGTGVEIRESLAELEAHTHTQWWDRARLSEGKVVWDKFRLNTTLAPHGTTLTQHSPTLAPHPKTAPQSDQQAVPHSTTLILTAPQSLLTAPQLATPWSTSCLQLALQLAPQLAIWGLRIDYKETRPYLQRRTWVKLQERKHKRSRDVPIETHSSITGISGSGHMSPLVGRGFPFWISGPVSPFSGDPASPQRCAHITNSSSSCRLKPLEMYMSWTRLLCSKRTLEYDAIVISTGSKQNQKHKCGTSCLSAFPPATGGLWLVAQCGDMEDWPASGLTTDVSLGPLSWAREHDLPVSFEPNKTKGHDGTAATALTSRIDEQGSIPCGGTAGFSHEEIVVDIIFNEVSGFSRGSPVSHAHTPRFNLVGSQDLLFVLGAAVAERLACSPLNKAIRVQSPAGSLRIIACGNRAGRCRWSAGFLGDLPFPPPLHYDAAPYSPQSSTTALNTSILRACDRVVPPPVKYLAFGHVSERIGRRGVNDIEGLYSTENSRDVSVAPEQFYFGRGGGQLHVETQITLQNPISKSCWKLAGKGKNIRTPTHKTRGRGYIILLYTPPPFPLTRFLHTSSLELASAPPSSLSLFHVSALSVSPSHPNLPTLCAPKPSPPCKQLRFCAQGNRHAADINTLFWNSGFCGSQHAGDKTRMLGTGSLSPALAGRRQVWKLPVYTYRGATLCWLAIWRPCPYRGAPLWLSLYRGAAYVDAGWQYGGCLLMEMPPTGCPLCRRHPTVMLAGWQYSGGVPMVMLAGNMATVSI